MVLRICATLLLVRSATGNILPYCTGGSFEDRIVGGCNGTRVDLSSSFTMLVVEKRSMSGEVSWYQRGCAGTLITPTMVLTAAHCDAPNLNAVIVNTTVVGHIPEGAQWATVARRYRHPEYDRSTQRFDFMLVELSEPVEERFRPFQISLATKSYMDSLGDAPSFVACGHGQDAHDGDGQKYLSCVEIPHRPECGEYGGKYHPESMICAGEQGKDACFGDSGGPLFHKAADGKWTLVGVTSWGISCGETAFPGIWARVSAAVEWIQGRGTRDINLRNSPAANGVTRPPRTTTTRVTTPVPAESPEKTRADILDVHNRLRCLHWRNGGNRWTANLSWSADLEAEATEKIAALTSSLGRAGTDGETFEEPAGRAAAPASWAFGDEGAVRFMSVPVYGMNPQEALIDAYKAGIYETVAATGEPVAASADEFYAMAQGRTASSEALRAYMDVIWRGSAKVGCASRRLSPPRSGTAPSVRNGYACLYQGAGESKSRIEMTPSEAWSRISSKAVIRKQDLTAAEACGIVATDIAQSKSAVDVSGAVDVREDRGAGVKDAALRSAAGHAAAAAFAAALAA